ncbi:hypothetical protein [Chromobacterium amazonense]|uniref:hypothetical protein n=1 Tax=Chromobacterium amazonense TaxID=1382803 RepID=UPI0031F64A65
MKLGCIRGILVAGMLCVGTAHAAGELESTNFTVNGVIKPMACSVSFLGGGKFDYGEIDSKKISGAAGDYAFFNNQPMKKFSIQCEADTLVSMKFIDNMESQRPEGVVSPSQFGLNSNNEEPVGYHYFHISNKFMKVVGGGKLIENAVYGQSADNKTWENPKAADTWHAVVGQNYYTAVDENKKAIPFKTLEASLGSVLAIKKSVKLKDEVEFEGVVTMELHYI